MSHIPRLLTALFIAATLAPPAAAFPREVQRGPAMPCPKALSLEAPGWLSGLWLSWTRLFLTASTDANTLPYGTDAPTTSSSSTGATIFPYGTDAPLTTLNPN